MISVFLILIKHILGFVIALAVFAASGFLFENLMGAEKASDPGFFSDSVNLIIIVLIQYIALVTINHLINGGRIRKGFYTATLYYMLVIFVMQLETLYFGDQLGITTEFAIRLFIFGAPLAIVIATYLNLYRVSSSAFMNQITISFSACARFVTVGAVIYIFVYAIAGYYLAWTHEEVRMFYGSKEELKSFSAHTLNVIQQQPDLFLLQLARGCLWSILALTILREMYARPLWFKIVSLSFLVAIPQNIAHIAKNPVITSEEVRMIHMVETVSSMIFYGAVLVFLFQKIIKNRLVK